jgi:hypothetical protein
MTLTYPIASNAAHPARLSPGYRSTLKRSPQKPLIIMRQTLSELTGPVYGHELQWQPGILVQHIPAGRQRDSVLLYLT